MGDRERVWYENGICYYKDEKKEYLNSRIKSFTFFKKYYKNFDKEFYRNKSLELGIGLIDGFIGNVGYDIGKEFEPKLKKTMDSFSRSAKYSDLDLIRLKIILGFSHKTSKLVIVTSMDEKKKRFRNY